MLEVANYLRTHTLEELSQEFPIRVSVHPEVPHWVNLDYTAMAFDEEVKNHPIVRECRGLLLSIYNSQDIKPVARGFDRFFNLGELDTGFDFSSEFQVYPKLDGSLIILYYANGKWRVKTRGSAVATGTTNVQVSPGKYLTFEDIFWGHVRHANWNLMILPPDYCYIFELTSPYNPVVVRYKETSVRLLAIRNPVSGKYVDIADPEVYDEIIHAFGSDSILKPLMTTVQLSDVTDYVNSVNGLEEEGVVLVDKKQNRLKVKNKDWCNFHKKVWGITARKAVELVVENDSDIDEICVYFPDIKSIVEETRKDLTTLYNSLYDMFVELNELANQKDFALAVLNNPQTKEYSNVLFAMRKGLTKEDIMSKIGKRYLDKYTEVV